MKKITFVLIVLMIIPILSNAQRWKHERLDIYAGTGTNFFFGDLGGGPGDASHYFSLKDVNWASTRPVVQLGIRYRLLKDLAVKPFLSYALLKADDADSRNIGRKGRNLHFRSNVYEIGTQFEYYFLKEKHLGRYTYSSYKGLPKLSAYASLGFGALYFNPKSESVRGNGDWQALRPMLNEARVYGYIAGFASVGLGAKYKLNERLSLGLDFSYRYTTTDFLDDASDMYVGKDNGFADKHLYIDYDKEEVSDTRAPLYPAGKLMRGDPRYKDGYMFTLITGYYKINSVFSMPKY